MTDFIPHGVCLAWDPTLMLLFVLSDAAIAIAYYTIPFALIYFIYKRRDLVFRIIFALTGAFILACGTTHIMDVVTLWYPAYWTDVAVKSFTGVISLSTAAAMFWAIPEALALPSVAQLEDANRRLHHEIGERQRAEAELRTLNAELDDALLRVSRLSTMGELSASIAHEISQPLSAIVVNGAACLRFLEAESPDREELREAREAVEDMLSDGKRAGAVLARVRQLARKAAPERTAVDLNGAISEVLSLVRQELQRSQVAMRTELDPNLPLVLADRVQVQQVVLNLVLNGIEAMRDVTDRPRVLRVISAAAPPADVVVTVEDTGIGFGNTDPERVFETFFTTKPEGIGMGLSISRSIIQAHGGRLWAAAGAPMGAVLSFTLPAIVGAMA